MNMNGITYGMSYDYEQKPIKDRITYNEYFKN